MKIDYCNVVVFKNGEQLAVSEYMNFKLKDIMFDLYLFLETTEFKFTKRNYNRNKVLKDLIIHTYYQMSYWRENNIEMDSYNYILHILNRKISKQRKILMLDYLSKNNKHTKLAYYLRFDKDSIDYRWERLKLWE